MDIMEQPKKTEPNLDPIQYQNIAPYHDILKEMDQYTTIPAWWRDKIFNPTMLTLIFQVAAMIIITIGTLYIHNWIAAIMGCYIIGSRIYSNILRMSLTFSKGLLAWQVRISNGLIKVVNDLTDLTKNNVVEK
jgi:hypothetical protein